MVVSDLVFDVVVFGALLLALLLDNVFPFSPALHGAALLLAVGMAAYFTAREMCAAMQRRGWWTQDSLATTVAISTTGFIYYFARNDSDLALLGLSVSLMMAALMTMISFLAALSAAWAERSARPVLGLTVTFAGALGLGALSGLLIFALSSDAPLLLKAVVLGVGAVLWKLREKMRPPARNDLAADAAGASSPSDSAPGAVPSNSEPLASTPMQTAVRQSSAPSGGLDQPVPANGLWGLMPQRGTLLDRFLPVLLLGALFFLAFRQNGPTALLPPGSPASASNSNQPMDNDAAPDGADGGDSNPSPDAAPDAPAPDAPDTSDAPDISAPDAP